MSATVKRPTGALERGASKATKRLGIYESRSVGEGHHETSHQLVLRQAGAFKAVIGIREGF
jgi:hypothetical protein